MKLWKRIVAAFMVLVGALLAVQLANIDTGFFLGLGIALAGLIWLVVRR